MYKTKSPILIICFNRPEEVAKIYSVLRLVKPERIYIAADAPRPSERGEEQKCIDTLNIFSKPDWPCTIYRKINKRNLGSYATIPAAVDWFFEHESQGIVLEDDCIPCESFFSFCDTILDRYKDDEHVMWVNGSNMGWPGDGEQGDYRYSRFAIPWGWAAWRRSWEMCKIHRNNSPGAQRIRNILHEIFPDSSMKRFFWGSIFRYAYSLNNWDFRLQLSIWSLGGVSCTPMLNQISNVGFAKNGVHGGSAADPRGNVNTSEIFGEINRPVLRSINNELDDYLCSFLYRVGIFGIIRMEIAAIFPTLRPIYRRLLPFFR